MSFSPQTWDVFKEINALFILVPALVGLKGNLDTCLASRLCTQANLGNLNSWKNVWKHFLSNIALVQVRRRYSLVVCCFIGLVRSAVKLWNYFMWLQVQSIVASLTAAVFAITASVFLNGPPDYRHALLMAASAVTTATTACFVLGE